MFWGGGGWVKKTLNLLEIDECGWILESDTDAKAYLSRKQLNDVSKMHKHLSFRQQLLMV